MYGITDLKKDTVIQIDGKPYKVIEYAQKQMGRGGSIVNTRLKNLLDGSVIPKTFKGQDKIEPADVGSRKLQFLYSDGSTLHFMDDSSFEQLEINPEIVGDPARFLGEGMQVDAQTFDNQVINIALPIKITLKVVSAPDVVRGDTQSTVQKTVELENGTEIMAPIFIKVGDVLVVDTRDGSYVERAR